MTFSFTFENSQFFCKGKDVLLPLTSWVEVSCLLVALDLKPSILVSPEALSPYLKQLLEAMDLTSFETREGKDLYIVQASRLQEIQSMDLNGVHWDERAKALGYPLVKSTDDAAYLYKIYWNLDGYRLYHYAFLEEDKDKAMAFALEQHDRWRKIFDPLHIPFSFEMTSMTPKGKCECSSCT